MSRPIKNNANFFTHFPHDRNSKTSRALRAKFGEGGYGIFQMILESLTGEDHFRMGTSELDFELLAFDFSITQEKFSEIYQYMIKLRILVENDGFFHCPELNKRLEPLLVDRKRKRDSNKDNQLDLPLISNIIPELTPDISPISEVIPELTPELNTQYSTVQYSTIQKKEKEEEKFSIDEKIEKLINQKNNPSLNADQHNLIIDQICVLRKEKEKISGKKEKETNQKAAEILLELKSSFSWRDKILRDPRINFTREKMDQYFMIFINELDVKDDLYKPLSEIKRHFFNWIIIKANKNGSPKQTKHKADPTTPVLKGGYGYNDAIDLPGSEG